MVRVPPVWQRQRTALPCKFVTFSSPQEGTSIVIPFMLLQAHNRRALALLTSSSVNTPVSGYGRSIIFTAFPVQRHAIGYPTPPHTALRQTGQSYFRFLIASALRFFAASVRTIPD
jgi:hypothetical protein